MKLEFIDYETRSRVDLQELGHDLYARDPSTEVLVVCAQYAREARPRVLGALPPDPSVVTVSWGEFDQDIFDHVEHRGARGLRRWLDLRNVAAMLGLPLGLGECAYALDLPDKKHPDGARLINTYCVPNEQGDFNALEGRDLFLMRQYCSDDVSLTRAIWARLGLRPGDEWFESFKAHVLPSVRWVRRMNKRGVPIDREAVRLTMERVESLTIELYDECVDLCGIKPSNYQRLLPWLRSYEDMWGNCPLEKLPNMQADTLNDLLEAGLPGSFVEQDQELIERVLQIRLLTSKAAVKKLARMLALSDRDGRARGCFQAHGAHTARLTSHLIQLQNLKKGDYGDYFELLRSGGVPGGDRYQFVKEAADASRGFILAPGGSTLLIADLSQVECRMNAWYAREEQLLRAFERGADVYKLMARLIYQVPLERVTKRQRSVGKFVVLSAGYQISGHGVARQARKYDLIEDLTELGRAAFEREGHSLIEPTRQELLLAGSVYIVDVFRSTFPEIVRWWYRLQDAFEACVTGQQRVELNGLVFERWDRAGKLWVTIQLPSGRRLYYASPTLYDGSLSYWGRKDKRFKRVFIYGGHLAENVASGSCYDIIETNTLLVERKLKIPSIMSVHDEGVFEVPLARATPGLLKQAEGLLATVPDYFEGLPLAAEGQITRRYTK